MTSRLFQVFIVTLTTLTAAASTAILLPSLPTLTSYFHASDNAIQLAVPLSLMGGFVAMPILGSLSDHYGRIPLMIAGMLIFLIGTIACFLAPTLPFFLTARFIQGSGVATAFVVGFAIIPDLYSNKEESTKIVTWMGIGISCAPVFAPLIGGYLHSLWGWKATFIFIALLILIVLGLLCSVSPLKKEKKPAKIAPLALLKNYKMILTDRNFLIYSSLFALLACGEWCYLTMIPFYFENSLHLSPEVFGIYLASSAGFKILGTFMSPFVLHHKGVMPTIKLGILISLGGSLALLGVGVVAPTLPLPIMLCVGLYLLGGVLIWGPSTSRSLQHFEKSRGAASAVRGLAMTFFFALGGLIGSLLNDASLLLLALFLCATSLSCWISFQHIREER